MVGKQIVISWNNFSYEIRKIHYFYSQFYDRDYEGLDYIMEVRDIYQNFTPSRLEFPIDLVPSKLRIFQLWLFWIIKLKLPNSLSSIWFDQVERLSDSRLWIIVGYTTLVAVSGRYFL